MDWRIKSIMDYVKFGTNLSDVSLKQGMFALAAEITFPFHRQFAKEIIIFIEQRASSYSRYFVSFFRKNDERIDLANEFLNTCPPDAVSSAKIWLSSEQKTSTAELCVIL